MSNTEPPSTPATPPPAKRSHTNTIIISTAAVLITGIVTAGLVISNSRDTDDPTPTVVKAANTPSASNTKTSPSPSPSQETLKLGDKVDINADHKFSAAVLSFKDKGIAGLPGVLQPGQKWAAVEVKVCNTGDELFEVSTFVWSLAYEDGARVEATHMSGGEFPQPLYPMEAKVPVDDCVRGHVMFEVPREGRPERVLYSPDSLDEPVEWQVGK